MRKVKPEDMAKIADQCMEAMLKMMSGSPGVGSVLEDSLQTIGALIEVVGNDFSRYMPHFSPYLCAALENYAESSVSLKLFRFFGFFSKVFFQFFFKLFSKFFQFFFFKFLFNFFFTNFFKVLLAAVGVVTDMCRAMNVDQLQQNIKDLMTLLYKALRSGAVHHTVKPQIIAAFGDAALALGPGFVDVSFESFFFSKFISNLKKLKFFKSIWNPYWQR